MSIMPCRNGKWALIMCWAVAAGWLKVPIEGVFPLAEAAEIHRRLEGRHVAGKLLLKA